MTKNYIPSFFFLLLSFYSSMVLSAQMPTVDDIQGLQATRIEATEFAGVYDPNYDDLQLANDLITKARIAISHGKSSFGIDTLMKKAGFSINPDDYRDVAYHSFVKRVKKVLSQLEHGDQYSVRRWSQYIGYGDMHIAGLVVDISFYELYEGEDIAREYYYGWGKSKFNIYN